MPNNMKQYRKTFLAPLETDLHNQNSLLMRQPIAKS